MTATALAPASLEYRPTRHIPFQLDAIARLYLMRQGMPVFDLGTGKQAPVTEPVLTPTGWKPVGDIQPGDFVIGADGNRVTVLSVHPQHSEEVWRMTFSDGSWTRCGPDHLWTVSQKKTGQKGADGIQRPVVETLTLTTREIMRRGIMRGRNKRWWIPVTAPVQYPPVSLPVDPYTLGVILGDGWIKSDGYVQVYTDKEILDALGRFRRTHLRPGCELGMTSAFREELVSLGLAGCHSWEKFVPDIYLRAPEQDRRALLAGLLDTDGHPSYSGGVEFTSTSEHLAEAVTELTESLGGQARCKGSRLTRYTHNGVVKDGRPSWRVNVKMPVQPFKLSRKMIRWVEPSKYPVRRFVSSIELDTPEKCVCIRVSAPDGLYLTRHHIVTHNTHLGLGVIALALADGEADLALVVCERNKLDDWERDFGRFTTISGVLRYHGAGRQKKLARMQPRVIITTYEIIRGEAAVRVHATKYLDGPFLDVLRGKKVIVVYDEISKLRNRSSGLYKAHQHMLRRLRKQEPGLRVIGMTGTPIETGWENAFNELRLIRPSAMPTVEFFNDNFIIGRDQHDRPWYNHTRMHKFEAMCRPLMLRKRKTDPDVIKQFPKVTENVITVEMHADQLRLYKMAEDLAWDGDGAFREIGGLKTVLRQLAGHPRALLRSDGQLARVMSEELGSALEACSCAKQEQLMDLLHQVISAGQKAVVFTFFGQSVLPVLREEIEQAGWRHWVHHGGMTGPAMTRSRQEFNDYCGAGVMLSSDAGARGVEFPGVSAIIEYEPAMAHGTRQQRLGRGSRIGAEGQVPLTFLTLVTEKTIEAAGLHTALNRNAQADQLLGDQTAEGRKQLYSMARKRR